MNEVVKCLNVIIEKLGVLINQQREGTELLDLLDLPDHLRKTLFALIKLGCRATAEEVSGLTGRARAVESGYLSQLVLMKYATRERVGRKVYYMKVKRGA